MTAPSAAPCACWSCDGQCGGTQDPDSCGPLAPDADGKPICEGCQEMAGVFGLDRVGVQVTISQDRVRLALKWTSAPGLPAIWLTAASARRLAQQLTERAAELEAQQ